MVRTFNYFFPDCQQVFSEDAGIVSSPGYGLVDSSESNKY